MTVQNTPEKEPLLFNWLGTALLTVGGVIGFIIMQAITLFIALSITTQLYQEKLNANENSILLLESDGTLVSISFIFNLLFVLFFCFVIIKIRRKKIRQYLAFNKFSIKFAAISLILWAVYVVVTEVLFKLFDRAPMDFLDNYYQSAEPLWLLIVGIVILVPIYEEVIFRGLLWRAIYDNIMKNVTKESEDSSSVHVFLGKWAWLMSSAITGLLFAGIHLQYPLFEISTIFVLALIFGYVRHRSGSVLLPIALHIVHNAVAMMMYVVLS